MPSFHGFSNWLFHSKSRQGTMSTTPPFEATHVIEWRYKTLEPLRKALKEFNFKEEDIKLRASKKLKNSVEIQLPRGRTLDDEQRKKLLDKAHEINEEEPSTTSDISDDES